jgi:hypothetical protein
MTTQGEYVCEYSGDLIDLATAKKREQLYIREDNENGVAEPMCYMYYLKYGGKNWCVDATKTTRIGRLPLFNRFLSSLPFPVLAAHHLQRGNHSISFGSSSHAMNSVYCPQVALLYQFATTLLPFMYRLDSSLG